MRAGLLSNPAIIRELNKKFISTWTLIDHVEKLAQTGDPFAKTLAQNWEYPLDMMFLESDGKLRHRLNAFQHLSTTDGDARSRGAPNENVFIETMEKQFPDQD